MNPEVRLLSRRRTVVSLGAVALLGLAPGAARAATYQERVLGADGAPVTVIEYASLTCPHCAAFHAETFPRLKSEYIDTGKVRFVFRDFPLDGTALLGAAVAQCAGADTRRYFGFLEVLFETQRVWATAPDPKAALVKIGRLGGLDETTVRACMEDQALLDAIVGSRTLGEQTYAVDSTPTLIINEKKYDGSKAFDDVSAAIAPLLPPS